PPWLGGAATPLPSGSPATPVPASDRIGAASAASATGSGGGWSVRALPDPVTVPASPEKMTPIEPRANSAASAKAAPTVRDRCRHSTQWLLTFSYKCAQRCPLQPCMTHLLLLRPSARLPMRTLLPDKNSTARRSYPIPTRLCCANVAQRALHS